jgi:hypothetical protein
MLLNETEHTIRNVAPRVVADLVQHRLPVLEIAVIEEVVDRRRTEIAYSRYTKQVLRPARTPSARGAAP